jgi:hypothetical protein
MAVAMRDCEIVMIFSTAYVVKAGTRREWYIRFSERLIPNKRKHASLTMIRGIRTQSSGDCRSLIRRFVIKSPINHKFGEEDNTELPPAGIGASATPLLSSPGKHFSCLRHHEAQISE